MYFVNYCPKDNREKFDYIGFEHVVSAIITSSFKAVYILTDYFYCSEDL